MLVNSKLTTRNIGDYSRIEKDCEHDYYAHI
jgi:hypothetical protein